MSEFPGLPRLPDGLLRWTGLPGAATAHALVLAAEAASGPLCVLAHDPGIAARLEEELRFFGGSALPILALPDYETLPYDLYSPHPDIISQRLRALARLPDLRRGIVIVDVLCALQRLPPRRFIDAHALSLAVGEDLDLEAFRARLVAAGYLGVPQVSAPGEFALRGSLFDIYPMGSEVPYRIDLLDRDLDSIRSFDPESQRSLERVERLELLPAREFPFSPEAIKEFRRRFRLRFPGDLTRMPLYRDLGDGIASAGIEHYLPLFHEQTATLFDYLPARSVLVLPGDEVAQLAETWRMIEERHAERCHDIERPILDPAELYLDPTQWSALAGQRPRILLQGGSEPDASVASIDFGAEPPPAARLDPRRPESVTAFALQLREDTHGRTLIAAESPGRRELLLEQLRTQGLSPAQVPDWATFLASSAPLAITVAPLASGVRLAAPRVTIYAEEQLFGERARQERRRRRVERDPARLIQQLADLRPGAPVVHEDYGVGRYRGMTTMEVGGTTGEFLVLEYAEGDKIYVPVAALDRVSRYTGAPPESAPLHKLGSEAWSKARARAAQRIRDAAAELLDVYSRRAARPGTALLVDEAQLRAFEAGFPFEETADQATAIEQVIADLGAPKPMDRVVCGDVGFGKTEVALRAAFVAVQAGKQVAVLVPTTLLAQQHYQTFADRFADWPVRIDSLSRMRGDAQAKAVLAGLAEGKVDVVVGTHRLLQASVKFKDLGLLIVDEEHRFGVKDKERLKQLRAEVDVLTLTATPIPRTLNMSLGGLRDLSLITTPPASRLAIRTFVSEWNDALVREACVRELRRGGQVYFVYNAVDTIERKGQQLADLLPEARIAIGHGQMRERDLEQVMLDFYHRRSNLLLCTTIIESGIDVPSANTIVIERADRFGLAQLHQLRGRVGRSHHQAYAYLLAPPKEALTPDAAKRLEAIATLDELGSGFVLATHDLEIRGAGELLGDEQSGQIHEIGFALYMELLERAVTALKSGREPDLERPLHHGPEVELHVPALLPEAYLPDVHTRLVMYKRIASAPTTVELDELQAENIDRFGPLEEPARNLFRIARLRIHARACGVERIELGASGGSVTFTADTPVDPGRLILFMQRQSKTHRFDGPKKIRVSGQFQQDTERFSAAEQLLQRLGECVPAAVAA